MWKKQIKRDKSTKSHYYITTMIKWQSTLLLCLYFVVTNLLRTIIIDNYRSNLKMWICKNITTSFRHRCWIKTRHLNIFFNSLYGPKGHRSLFKHLQPSLCDMKMQKKNVFYELVEGQWVGQSVLATDRMSALPVNSGSQNERLDFSLNHKGNLSDRD